MQASRYDPALSRRALLLSLHPDGSELARAIAPDVSRVDWAWVIARAKTHKVAPLLAARLEASALDAALDANMRADLDAIRADARARAAVADDTVAYLVEEMGRAAVPFFVIKGSVLAHHVYRQPNLRRFADVDVVVLREHVARAEEVLRAMGYREGGVEDLLATRPHGPDERRAALTLTRRVEGRILRAYTWYPPDGRFLCVDLHWDLSRGPLQISSAQLWARTTQTTLETTRVTTLDPAATLVHLVNHATTGLLGNARLLHFSDVAWAATRHADQEAAVWQLAREWKVEASLTFALQLTQHILGTDLPLVRHGAPSSWRAIVGHDSFLLSAPQLKDRSGPVRLWRELVWGLAVRCLRWNATVMAAVALARLRWKLFRWRRRSMGHVSRSA